MLKKYVIFIGSILFLSGCGDNGNRDNIQPAIAKVTLATQGALPAGKALSGIEVTLQLPTGVTPALAANGAVDSSVVKGSGVLASNASLYTITYSPASGTAPGTLNFVIYSIAADGFGIGEFATISLNKAAHPIDFAVVSQSISDGTALSVIADYKVTMYSLRDLGGAEVKNFSVTFTAEAI